MDVIGSREAGRLREAGRCCSAPKCKDVPQYLAAYRYSRSDGRPVTSNRPLCVTHARVFSMKRSLAWPDMLRRVRRQIVSVWSELAA